MFKFGMILRRGTKNNNAKKADKRTEMITEGLGGKDNIDDVSCCCTRLRLMLINPSKVKEEILKESGACGVIKKGNNVQVIYGPAVGGIKKALVGYLNE